FLFAYAVLVQAQDVSGFWKGTLTMPGGCFPINNIELQITVKGTSINGNSYHYLDANNYIKKIYEGSYVADEKKVIIQEGNVTNYRIPQQCIVCIKRYELTYSKVGNVETLSGGWTGKIMGTNNDCQSGSITLSRIKESLFKDPPEIKVDTGTIRLDFYDNGVVDGDSITVLVNRNVVLSNQRLSAKPITSYITIDMANPYQEVEMVAENLGSIPPNTALLIVTAGTKRYQVFLTSTETKSAAVRFIYDKSMAVTDSTYK
ncbi:MAG TPA: hypothetical protein VM888_07665, partial [Chitinophagaceae bacterium]|nr:hypothetical protein [Chitinophagaceae bacterium]